MLKNRKAQNFSEYAIVLSLVIAALMAIQVYVKRGLQGRYKDASDFVFTHIEANKPDESDVKILKQYEPYYVETNMNTLVVSGAIQTFNKEHQVGKVFIEGTFRDGTQKTTSTLGEYETYKGDE